jgi:hypothetical protein
MYYGPFPNLLFRQSDGRINQNKGYSGAELNVPPLDVIPEDTFLVEEHAFKVFIAIECMLSFFLK